MHSLKPLTTRSSAHLLSPALSVNPTPSVDLSCSVPPLLTATLRKFTMPVTQLTHARHQNIYQMCGTTWNDWARATGNASLRVKAALPAAGTQHRSASLLAPSCPCPVPVAARQTITWNMCGVLQFIRKNGWAAYLNRNAEWFVGLVWPGQVCSAQLCSVLVWFGLVWRQR